MIAVFGDERFGDLGVFLERRREEEGGRVVRLLLRV